MFILSKIVWIVSQPLSVALIFSIAALICMFAKRRHLAIFLMIASVILLTTTLFTTVGSVMIQQLEDRFPRPSDPGKVGCIIVLGGGFATDVSTVRGGYEVNDAGDRFIEAYRLLNKYPGAKVLVSGGDGFVTGGFLGDAEISERFFAALGISADRLIKEPDSRTTFENAVNSKEILQREGLSDCLLITSGFHMPRSVGIFRKLGINVTPWAVDYRSIGKEHLRFDISQSDANASMLALATKEWIGMVGYYFAGRTSSLFPSP